MKFTYDRSTNTYTLDSENRQVMFTGTEIAFISQELDYMSIRADITDIVDDYNGDVIDLDKLDMSRDEFEQEVFDIIRENMKDGYYDGGNPSYETIQDIVLDTAEDYDIRID